MDLLQAALLGILQGLTEFLPISSSGHLVLFQDLFGVENHDLTFDIVVHLGTLLSIATLLGPAIIDVLLRIKSDIVDKKPAGGVKIASLIVIGTIPAVIVGFGLKDSIENLFSSNQAVGIGFLLTAGILLVTRYFSKSQEVMDLRAFKNNVQGLSQMGFRNALLIGVAQSFAIAPGISRSGSTIAAGLVLGESRAVASYFSFLLAIPAIIGAAVLQLSEVDLSVALSSIYIVGFVSSYLAGVLGLWLVLKIVKSGRLEYFSIYLVLVGAYTLLK